jgi:DNA primase
VKFPQDFIDRVREASNIVAVISQYVQLRRSGGNHQGLCPFHHEKSPSFSVSEDKQVYYCFGCKASGNVFGFVQRNQGLTFPETVEYLARRAAIPIPASSYESSDSQRDTKTTLYKINGLAAQFYHNELKRLPQDHEARRYLEQRGLTEELVNTYKLGYAPDAWSNLAQHFGSQRVPIEGSEQLGLIKRRASGQSGHYDLFRHRLMFPIFSPTGQCIGFGGRVFSKEQQPKYLNSPDAPIFHKGKVFYGLDHSAKYIRTEDEVIVVEGYMDWLALSKAGIFNVVATLGTALTADHARLVKRYTNRLLLLFDGDEAGKSAARRSLPILLGEGLHARGLYLPDQLDPDDFIKQRGAPQLRTLLSGAPDLFDLVSTEQWLQAKGSPTGKIQLLDDFAPVMGRIQDARLRALYCANFANLVSLDVRLVEQSVAKLPTVPREKIEAQPIQPVAPVAVKIDLNKVPPAEVGLLNVMLLKEVYLQEALQSDVVEYISHPGCKAVFQRIAEVYRQMPSKFDTLSALLADEVRPAEIITRFVSEPYTSLSTEAAIKLLQDCIKRVKNDSLKSKSKALVSSLRGAGDRNPSEQLEQIMNIQKDRRSLNRDS